MAFAYAKRTVPKPARQGVQQSAGIAQESLVMEQSLNKIENVLRAVLRYQQTSLGGDFEKRQLETSWPDIQGAFDAIKTLRAEIAKMNLTKKENP